MNGPTPEQTTAQQNLMGTAGTAKAQTNQGINTMTQARGAAMPFYMQRAKTGLPFFPSMTDYTSGQSAQAFAPARANLLRATSRYGVNSPSGYRDSMLTNLEAARARAFDTGLTGNLMANEQAKQAGMQGVMQTAESTNPLGWAGLGSGVNTNVMGANYMRKPNVWGTLGGLAMQGMKTAGEVAAA